MVLDVGATAQELMELAAEQRQITVDEIRERIAHGDKEVQVTTEQEHETEVIASAGERRRTGTAWP
jgi:hypothetical protein